MNQEELTNEWLLLQSGELPPEREQALMLALQQHAELRAELDELHSLLQQGPLTEVPPVPEASLSAIREAAPPPPSAAGKRLAFPRAAWIGSLLAAAAAVGIFALLNTSTPPLYMGPRSEEQAAPMLADHTPPMTETTVLQDSDQVYQELQGIEAELALLAENLDLAGTQDTGESAADWAEGLLAMGY